MNDLHVASSVRHLPHNAVATQAVHGHISADLKMIRRRTNPMIRVVTHKNGRGSRKSNQSIHQTDGMISVNDIRIKRQFVKSIGYANSCLPQVVGGRAQFWLEYDD